MRRAPRAASGEGAEDRVPSLVAVGVVDRLEMVEVEHDDPKGMLVSLGAGHLALERLIEGAPVGDARQGVCEAQGLELFEQALVHLPKALLFDGPLDRQHHLVRMSRRFGEVVVGPEPEGPDDGGHVVRARPRENDDLDARRALLDRGEHLEAVEARHVQVGDRRRRERPWPRRSRAELPSEASRTS